MPLVIKNVSFSYFQYPAPFFNLEETLQLFSRKMWVFFKDFFFKVQYFLRLCSKRLTSWPDFKKCNMMVIDCIIMQFFFCKSIKKITLFYYSWKIKIPRKSIIEFQNFFFIWSITNFQTSGVLLEHKHVWVCGTNQNCTKKK